MAYVRFSECDVYMYPSVSGYIECCCCHLSEYGYTRFYDVDVAIKHLRQHVEYGHMDEAGFRETVEAINADAEEEGGSRDTRKWNCFKHIKQFEDI